MSKLKGSYKSADNIEVVTSHPLDPRVKWDSWDSLTDNSDWPINEDGKPYLYSGLIVSVNESEVVGKQDWQAYILNDINGWNIRYGNEGSGWKKITTELELVWEDDSRN
jgi:hypothetical protein